MANTKTVYEEVEGIYYTSSEWTWISYEDRLSIASKGNDDVAMIVINSKIVQDIRSSWGYG